MKEKEQLPTDEFLHSTEVFFVGSDTDDTVLVAIHPEYNDTTQMISWWDTVKERMKKVETVEVNGDVSLTFTDSQSDKYIFVPMSLPLYNNVVKNQLIAGKEFNTEEEMLEAFKETLNQY
jgi:hypothetical protein